MHYDKSDQKIMAMQAVESPGSDINLNDGSIQHMVTVSEMTHPL